MATVPLVGERRYLIEEVSWQAYEALLQGWQSRSKRMTYDRGRLEFMSPLLSHMYELGLFEAVAKPQRECFAAALTFARAEGIIPAPEPSHAIAAVVEEAKKCAESGEEKVILTALCGHGHFDMVAYERYLAGDMVDFELPQDRIDTALRDLPQL